MSITRRILFGGAANWLSRATTIALGVLLMPVLFRNLPKEELGVWLLLGQTWAGLNVLDLGFGITLTRRIAFACGESGAKVDGPLSQHTLTTIADLVVS